MAKKNNSTLKEENLVLPMSIEEALEIVENSEPLHNPNFCGGKLFDAINTLTALAKWYNSQDLIQRNDAIDSVKYCIDSADDVAEVIRTIASVPKAKPQIGHIITVNEETYDAIKNSEVPDHTKLIEEVRAQEELILKERKAKPEQKRHYYTLEKKKETQ